MTITRKHLGATLRVAAATVGGLAVLSLGGSLTAAAEATGRCASPTGSGHVVPCDGIEATLFELAALRAQSSVLLAGGGVVAAVAAGRIERRDAAMTGPAVAAFPTAGRP